MSAAHMLALLLLLLTAGCSGLQRPASQPPSPAGAPSPDKATAAATTPGPAAPTAKGASGDDTTASGTSAAQRPALASPAPAAAQTPLRKGQAAGGTAKPAAAPLDLALLEQRLRETEAIGVFTKIALKNQVDDLLGKFRAYYQGKTRTSLAELRQPYDMLLLKLLSLLQDSDPGLARAIVASREVIWGMLADPNTFATL